jgi:hypothetical protein
MTNTIISFCDELTNTDNKLDSIAIKKTRIYIRYLLKIHWDENLSLTSHALLKFISPKLKFHRNNKLRSYGKETIEMIKLLDESIPSTGESE